ncbi:hypothetical protein PSPO01_10726 [Paraphaeosphaeria sporulosa]
MASEGDVLLLSGQRSFTFAKRPPGLESSLAQSVGRTDDLLSNPVIMQVLRPNKASQRRDFGYRFPLGVTCYLITANNFRHSPRLWHRAVHHRVSARTLTRGHGFRAPA